MAERGPVELVGERLSLALAAGRPVGNGQRRTYYADLAGTPVVVKWGLDPDLPEKLPYIAGQIPELHRRGIPVPRILAHGPLDDDSYGYVHVDLNLGNILVRDGHLSGIIDTEHLGVGDRCVDLARLAFEWHWLARSGTGGLAADGMGRLAAFGRALSGDAWWRVAVAYELISRVGWRSEHHTEIEPHSWLPACAEFLDAPAIQ
jgi:hypothetical protein